MNTLTLFNAYVKAHDGLQGACVLIAGGSLDTAQFMACVHHGLRFERQRNTFAAAIRARLTPPRKRVDVITIGEQFANVYRTHTDDGGRYLLTPASRRRLLDACQNTMDAVPTQFGIELYRREVTA